MYILIIIIAIIIFVIWTNKKSTIETFNPYLNYDRIYPGLFSLNTDYMPYNKSYYMYPDGYYKPSASAPNYRYYPGYRDYWYIPMHEYLKSWMGSRDEAPLQNPNCIIPSSTSEYCIKQYIESTGNLDLAIQSCTVPAKYSPQCLNQKG